MTETPQEQLQASRLAELNETRGAVERALARYGKFLETWRYADRELRTRSTT